MFLIFGKFYIYFFIFFKNIAFEMVADCHIKFCQSHIL